MKINIDNIDKTKLKSPPSEIPVFGKVFTNRMFIQKYSVNDGWHNAKITEYSNISLSPSAQIFHYGQEIFEGLKANRSEDGKILLFRPQDNIRRFNKSADRMQMPQVDEKLHLEAIKKLVLLEKEWIPKGIGSSLYLRPVMIATEPTLWMPSNEYIHYIIACPTGEYILDKNNSTISVLVEENYKRAVKGGSGEAKTGGNYAAGLKAHKHATQSGYNQVLWLDAQKNKYVEEAGTMNIFFVYKNGLIVTPALNGSILNGIIRNSVITLAKESGFNVQEKTISITEIINSIKKEEIIEVFGTGTAASILPIGKIGYQSKEYFIGKQKMGITSEKLLTLLRNIQYGKSKDNYGWTVEVI